MPLGPAGRIPDAGAGQLSARLLPFGESVIWTRNILYMVCAGLSCAAASLARRNRNRGGTPMFALVFIISRMPSRSAKGTPAALAGRRTDRHGHRLRLRADGGAQRKTEGGRR